jgi:hypothetical protein
MSIVETMGGCNSKPGIVTGSLKPINNPTLKTIL